MSGPGRKPNRAPIRPFLPGEKVVNKDGSWSTERTVTIDDGTGKYMNVPTLWVGSGGGVVDTGGRGKDGQQRAAARAYEGYSKRKFKRYDDPNTADSAAAQREAEWQKLRRDGTEKPRTSLYEDGQ
jgi:hypothetical protein